MAPIIKFTRPRRGGKKGKSDQELDRFAKFVFACIQVELDGLSWFTRDEVLLMQGLRANGKATISTYGDIRPALDRLVHQGKLVELSRTEMCLRENQKAYNAEETVQALHAEKIARMIASFGSRPFSLLDIMEAWTGDNYLSPQSKRVALRFTLRHLVRAEQLALDETTFTYTRIKKADSRAVA